MIKGSTFKRFFSLREIPSLWEQHKKVEWMENWFWDIKIYRQRVQWGIGVFRTDKAMFAEGIIHTWRRRRAHCNSKMLLDIGLRQEEMKDRCFCIRKSRCVRNMFGDVLIKSDVESNQPINENEVARRCLARLRGEFCVSPTNTCWTYLHVRMLNGIVFCLTSCMLWNSSYQSVEKH